MTIKYSSVSDECEKCELYRKSKCKGLIYFSRQECPDYLRKKMMNNV